MSFNLSGLRLVTLEGIHGINETKQKFDVDGFCATRMYGSGKETDECIAMRRFDKNINSMTEVPHYSDVLTDPYMLASIINRQIPFIMTDKYRNIHIVGYMDDETFPHTHFKNLWDVGTLFKGIDKSYIVDNPNQVWYRNRDIGGGWAWSTAYKMAHKDDRLFYRIAKQNEERGYNKVPYFYIFKDVDTYDFWTVASVVVNAVMAIGSTFLPALSKILTPSITQGFQTLINLGNKFAQNPNYSLTLIDVQSIVVDALSPIVGLDVEWEKIMNKGGADDEYIDTIKSLSTKALKSFSAIEEFKSNPTQALQKLGDIFEVTGDRRLKSLQKDLSVRSVLDVAVAIKKPVAEVEKIVNQVNNSEIIDTLVTQFDKFKATSMIEGATISRPIQQFLVNIHAGLNGGIEELTGAIPNSPGIINAISQITPLNVEQFAALLSIPLNLPVNNLGVLDELLINAMVERAIEYSKADIPFVLPSNLSEPLQRYLINYIPRVNPNADVRTVTVKPNFYMEFM